MLKRKNLLATSNNILISLKYNVCQLLNEREINDARQTAIHRAEPLLSQSSAFQLDVAIEEQKS
jgi:hypothetical protein